MQQRQPRLGDILDDYCPRERRVTNHVVVAMIGDDVKQTRCSTCDADHDYKHAKVPRPRKKSEPAALYSQVLAAVAPKKVVVAPYEPGEPEESDDTAPSAAALVPSAAQTPAARILDSGDAPGGPGGPGGDDADDADEDSGGPVHRPLIRAQLPRSEGQPPAPRPAPDFTIRQPGGGRPGRFRPRPQPRGGQSFQGGGQSGNGNGNVLRGGAPRGGSQRQPGSLPGSRSPMSSHSGRRHGAGGGKRSK